MDPKNQPTPPDTIDLGATPREKGEYPGADASVADNLDRTLGGGGTWLPVVLWVAAAFCGLQGLTSLAGFLGSLSDPSVSAWANVGIFGAVVMLLLALLLALAARAAGGRRRSGRSDEQGS